MTPIERRLSSVVAKAMKRFGVPGVAVGIVHGEDEHRVARGITCIDFPLDVDAQTLFQIGSTTKTFTGTVLMTLVEEGALDLEAPVRTYLPSFKVKDPDATAHATVRHLVTHTGGWLGDFFADTGRGDDAVRTIVKRMATGTPQITPLGAAWSYNNAGFYVAGLLIEQLTGARYEDVVTTRILRPLGMDRTFWFAEDVITHKTAIGHLALADGTLRVARPWGLARSANPAGGIVSNVDDQLAYLRFHLGRGPKGVLKASSIEQMRKPLAEAGSMADAVGVTWLLEKIGGRQIVKHGGSVNGHMSELLLVPGEDFGITVLTNGSRGHELGRVVLDWTLAEVLDIRAEAPTFTAVSAPGEYTGRYRVGWGHFEVTRKGSGLLLTAQPSPQALERQPELVDLLPPALPIAMVRADHFRVRGAFNAGARVEFLRDGTDAVAWMRHGGRVYARAGA
jgi:CubicO group peptidase (beta-lactamase class C family)